MREQQKSCASFYEYGFRDYDSQLARWHCIDPSAESYIASSPYHFVGNNPIVNREIDGANYSQEFYDVYAEYLQDAKQGWQGHGGVRDYTGQRPGTDGYTYNWATGEYQNTNGETVTWGEVSSSEWFNGIMSKAETFEWKDVSGRYNNTEGGFTYNEEDGTYHLNDAADKVMAWVPVENKGEIRNILDGYDGPKYHMGYPPMIGNAGGAIQSTKAIYSLLLAGITVIQTKVIYTNYFARFSDKDRESAFESSKDENGVPRCYYCGDPLVLGKGSPNSYEADHFFPNILGGLNKLFNLRPSCRTCNRSKGKKIFGKEWNPFR